MDIQTITDVLKANAIKSEVITTRFGYKMASINLNSMITFPHLLEIIANSELDKSIEIKQFGKSAVVFIPGSKE